MTDYCTECLCHENSSNQTSELIVTLPTSTVITFTDGIDYGGNNTGTSFPIDILFTSYNSFYVHLGCLFPHYNGDGFCDDDTNNEICGFDGGDCCLDDPNLLYCFLCICNETGTSGANSSIETTLPTVTTQEYITTSIVASKNLEKLN